MIKEIKDEYQIIGELGAGGMATIYKAIQKSLDRPVAIKELKRSYQIDSQIVQRFEREAKMSASFQHENIVHIYDYWKRPGYCIVMEFVDGTDVANILEKTGPLPVDVGVMIALQVCSALDYAHMRGLIHRDIKPSNVMVKRNGEVKLMDFGIAHTKRLQTLTQPGTFLGTPAYMSPEQILGQSLDVQSDIFSFGIVLFEMFTGVKPFEDEEMRSVSTKILKDRFRSPRSINRRVPRRLQRVIRKCLRKKPQRRYGSVQELSRALGKLLAGTTNKSYSLKRISDYLVGMNVFEAPPESETMVITKVPRRSLWNRFLAFIGILLALLAGAAYYYYYYLPQQTPGEQPGLPSPSSILPSLGLGDAPADPPKAVTSPPDAPAPARSAPKRQRRSR